MLHKKTISDTPTAKLRTLRRKLIAVCFVVTVIVFSTITIGISASGYGNLVHSADKIINIIEDNGGDFPSSFYIDDSDISIETPFESRFFTVTIDSSGKESTDTDSIVSVDSTQAIRIMREAMSSGSAHGFINSFRYEVRTVANGNTVGVFLDRGRQLRQFDDQIRSIITIELFSLIAITVLISIFSKEIISPVVESHEKQKQFIADAGHDIKTPIAVISADADVLSYEVGEDNEWIEDIKRQCEKMTGLVEDLMFITRMEKEKHAGNSVTFDASRIIEEEASSYKSISMNTGKELSLSIEDGIELTGDLNGMRRLVSVLCDNAMKYSSDDSKIFVSFARKGRNAILSVENAVDEHPSNTSRWFDRFYREDKARNHDNGNGYGIGLSLAKAVVESFDGNIKAVVPKRRDELTIIATFPCRDNRKR